MGRSKTKHQKKSRAVANHVAEETYSSVPHSFVFHRGQVGKNVGQLVLDMRRVMEPYTAESLKVRKNNVLKDFVAVAGPLGVTHFMIFSKTTTGVNMRLARLPKGPTLHFKVLKYSLVKDVVSSLKKHRMHEQQFTHHPLLVLSNFGVEGMHVKLITTMFQNMFPSINVQTVNLNNIKRCVLLSYDPATQEIQFRHYSLKVVPVGMSRGVKKLMQERCPNMSKFEDISELLIKGANLSESEAEQDGEYNITELPQVYSGRGNMASQQSAVRLTEIGPRMTLQLMKIQEGMGDGNILYHSMITKTEEEIQEILERREARMKEKEERRKKQEQNISLKKEKQEEHKKKSLEGIKNKQTKEEDDSDVEDPGLQDGERATVESDDDKEYYRQAVGEEPDEDMFPKTKKRQFSDKSHGPFKKRKMSPGKSPNDRDSRSPKRTGPGGQQRDRKGKDQPGKVWKKSKEGEKVFGKNRSPAGKAFRSKNTGERENKFGGKKKFDGKKKFEGNKNRDKSKNQRGKSGFKSGGTKQGFKQRKGKGFGAEARMAFNVSACERFQIGLLPAMYSVEFVVALAGNLFALRLLLLRERGNWHSGVVLSCNLAISDLLYILTLPLLIVYYSLGKHWMFGDTMCKIERFLFTLNLYVSIFFVMAISVNRCVALVWPFFTRSKVEPAHIKAISVVIWIVVGVISCPVLKFASVCHHEYNNQTLCVSFCDRISNDAKPHFTYKLFLTVFGCLVPFLVTFISYCVVVRVVWQSVSITILEKRKIGLLVMSVILLYAISFVPYHVSQTYLLYLRVHNPLNSVCWVYKMYQVSKGLATLNMCIHPILYMAVFDSIRVACCGKTSEDNTRVQMRK
ncbi:suppressor of SWI4 1 homolog [Cololabis saira]|uniref:suppressor of SWI4 1 homolog n=1 Tax=Cololabis saira TaxID=129043 RepID=UPI002AD422A3|nr:suppressor of SWI4 1 homolog [Cololabis saira]